MAKKYVPWGTSTQKVCPSPKSMPHKNNTHDFLLANWKELGFLRCPGSNMFFPWKKLSLFAGMCNQVGYHYIFFQIGS